MSNLIARLFDTETASLQGGVCDIAMVSLNDQFEVVWQGESLINPEMAISPQATEIHGISDHDVQFAPTLAEWLASQGQPFHADDQVLTAYNVAFDIRMCKAHLPSAYSKSCALRMARTLYPDAPDHKLQTMRDYLGLEGGVAHRAMGDVVTTANLLRKMHSDHGLSLADLLEVGARKWTGDDKLTFGKHKGMKLKNLPNSYVVWLLGQPDLDPDLRAGLLVRTEGVNA